MIICAFVYMVESAVAMKRGTTALNDVPLWGMRVSCGELPAITRCRRKEIDWKRLRTMPQSPAMSRCSGV